MDSASTFAKKYCQLVISRFISENCLVFLLQYLGFMLSTFLSPVWFATGTACGFVFLRGYSVLPGIIFGSFFALYLTGSSLNLASACSFLILLQTVLLVYLTQRYVTATLVFYRLAIFLKFVLLACLITALISVSLIYICYPNLSAKFYLWLHWWLADLNGIFGFAFALIALDTFFPQIQSLKKINLFKLSLSFCLLLVLTAALLLSHRANTIVIFSVLLLLLTQIINFYYRWCGISAAIFLMGLVLGMGASFSLPFYTVKFSAINILYIQFILLSASLLGFILTTD